MDKRRRGIKTQSVLLLEVKSLGDGLGETMHRKLQSNVNKHALKQRNNGRH